MNSIVLRLCGVMVLATGLAACTSSQMASVSTRGATSTTVAVAAAPSPATPSASLRIGTGNRGSEVSVQAYAASAAPVTTSGNTALNGLIERYAAHYNMPASLLHRVVKRESGYNPGARNGPYYGLMQIRHDTARSMGYSGSAAGLLDAETNLRFAGKYLAGAYMVAGGDPDRAVRLYSRGYYYDAKRQGLLEETGLRR